MNQKIMMKYNQMERRRRKQDELKTSLDAGFDLSDQQMDEQLEDSESLKESTENVLQKTNINNIDQEYKVFTTEFDEIAKAETIRRYKRNSKIKKKFRSTISWFPRSNNQTCK